MAADTASSEISETQMRLFAGVLDAIIPPGEGGAHPGAGEIGLGEILLQKVPELTPVLVQGLAVLREELENRQVADFAALAEDEKHALLEQVGVREPGFLPGLLFHTYANYYQQPRVLEALGLEARPPYPRGYELEAGDLSLLDPVRKRPRLYRRC